MLVIKDFATTTIASALTAAATSIVVSDASRLPALPAGDHFDLVLQKFTDRNYVEIVRVTGVSGNTLTVARGRDGTMGRAFSIGDYAEVRLTVGVFSTYVSQLVEGKVDKDFSYVNQRLQVVNTGDLVGASLALLYAAGTGHGTIVSGGEGVNKQTPYIALRPLGHANAATQMKYTDDGSLSLVGGTRSASFGFVLSEHSFDSNGFPNAVSNDANNYVNRARSKITAGNSGLHFLADAALNARRFGIQAGHSLASDAASYGILDLNPYGGLVRVNGGTVYHTGYMPTPAALGVLALSGGTLTGNFDQNFGGLGYGFRFSVSGSLVYFQGGKRNGDEADQKLRISGYLGKPLTEFNILTAGHGIALVNGARLYTEQYLPTPDVLGCVPSARTINSKPLSANIVLAATDVAAIPYVAATQTSPVSAFFDSGASSTQMGVRAADKDIYLFGDANRVGIYSRIDGLVDGAMIAARYADDGRVEFGANNKMTRLYGNSILFNGGNVQLENTNLGLERAFVIERGAKRARLTVGQPFSGIYAAMLGSLNQAGNGYHYIGVSEDGKPLCHDGAAAYRLATNNYNAEQAGGQELYTLAAPAGAVGGMYYPVLIPISFLGSDISVSTVGGGAALPMNFNIFKGYVRASGWSDRGSVVEGSLYQYDAAERSIRSVHAPAESGAAVVFYIEGRAFPVTILRTSAENLAPPTTHQTSVTYGTSVFPAVVTPSAATGTKAMQLIDFAYGSGPYNTQATNSVFSGSVALGSSSGPVRIISAGVYGISGFLTSNPLTRVSSILVYDGGASTQYYAAATAGQSGFQVRYNGATGLWDCPASSGYMLTAIVKIA